MASGCLVGSEQLEQLGCVIPSRRKARFAYRRGEREVRASFGHAP
jgi:hypothetical protein